MQGTEIEKKYKIRKLPEDLEKYQKIEIEQSYLNYGCDPTLRTRRYNEDEYILSYKAKKKGNKSDLSVHREVELPISEEAYENLKAKADGRVIRKTRYVVPLGDGLKAEIDMFRDFFEGVCYAEIEFESEEQANNYSTPDWLGEDVSSEKKLKNWYMAVVAESIEEYRDFFIKKENDRDER